MNFPTFCADHSTTTAAEVKSFIVQKLKQRLKATERIVNSGELNPQFERLAADIINERDELTHDTTDPAVPSLNPVNSEPATQTGADKEVGSSWFWIMVFLAIAYYVYKNFFNRYDRIPKKSSLLI